MCNVLLRDPLQRLWQLSAQDDQTLQTTLTSLASNVVTADPVLTGVPPIKLTADIDGTIVATPIGSAPAYALPYIPLQSPTGKIFKLTYDNTSLLATTPAPNGTPLSTVPRPIDVTMSQWSDTIGVICPKCANAGVTISGDLSCWCCVCSTFVNPEDTTIVIVLDE